MLADGHRRPIHDAFLLLIGDNSLPRSNKIRALRICVFGATSPQLREAVLIQQNPGVCVPLHDSPPSEEGRSVAEAEEDAVAHEASAESVTTEQELVSNVDDEAPAEQLAEHTDADAGAVGEIKD